MASYHAPHRWDLTPAAARALQTELAPQVDDQSPLGEITRVAGLDVGFEQGGRITRAAVVVLDYPGLRPLDQALVRQPTRFPYVPGLLSFREVPALLAALGQLPRPPDLLICDGQGRAHPRRLGVASHLGLITQIPAIGCAKSRLIGTHAPLAPEKGAWQGLYDRDELIGAVVRSRARVQPLYVSVGHGCRLSEAIDWVLRLCPRYRLPETTRAAHRLASG